MSFPFWGTLSYQDNNYKSKMFSLLITYVAKEHKFMFLSIIITRH